MRSSYDIEKNLTEKYGIAQSGEGGRQETSRSRGKSYEMESTLLSKYPEDATKKRRSAVADWKRRYNSTIKEISAKGVVPNETAVNSLIQDFDQIREFADRMGLPNAGRYIDNLQTTVRKQKARAATASGLLAEDAEALRAERDGYRKELGELSTDEIKRKMNGVQILLLDNANQVGFGAARQKYEQGLREQYAQLEKQYELAVKVADIEKQLDQYDRIDSFQQTRITPMKGQTGFATAREDYAAGAPKRERQKAQNGQALKQAYQELEALTWNKSPSQYQSEPAYLALIERIDRIETEQQSEDELGAYLGWYEGLSDDHRQALLDGSLNSQAPENRELVASTPAAIGKHWERMTEDEINAYYYIANTEGISAAGKFLEELQVTLDWRHTTGRENAAREQMADSPTWANALRGVGTVGANVIAGPMAFASDALNTMQGKAFNPYSNAHYLQNITGTTRGAAAGDIQKSIAGDGKSKFWNGVGEVAANAYQAGLSTLDSFAGIYTMGNAYTAAMGMGAASSRMRELYESGATDAEIYRGAVGSGILEALFEKVSLDSLAENFIKANPEKWIRKMLTQAGVEGSEEVFTEITNQILDAINRGVNSDHNQRVWELMNDAENPMSREEAETKAAAEDAMDVFWAGLGGVMSGGMSAVGGAAMDSSRQNMSGQDILARNAQEQIIAEAQELRPGDTLAQDMESKQKEGTLGKNEGILGGIKDSRDATRLGRLLEQNVADMTSRDRRAVQTAVEARLKAEGTRILDLNATAEAITKSLAGEGLGVYDRFLLASNEKVADKVRKEVYSAADGTTAENAWVNRIETYSHMAGTKLRETNVEKAGREAMETTVKEEFGPYAEQVMELYAMNRGSQNRAAYVAEAKQMYQAGMDGVALDQAPETSTLTDWQREIIWDMGQGKSDYDYDNNQGFATIKGETTPVNIVGVESAGDGKLTLRTDEGETVDAKNVTFGSYSQSKLYSVISAMGVDRETANEIVAMSQETGLDLNTFSRAMQDAFFAGRNGIPFADIGDDRYAMKLTQEERKAAWQAGRAAARERAVKKGKRVQQGKHGRARGGVKIEDSARSIRSLNAQQQAGMNAANVLGAMGLDITVYASSEEQRAKGMENGHIQLSDGSIHIDLNAGDSGEGVMAWALSHEFTHFVEEMSPEKFQTFQEVLFEELGQNGQDVMTLIEEKVAVLSSQEKYSEFSEDRLWEIATSEVVAEMMEPMLTDTDAIARISDNLRQQDKGLWEKIKTWLSGMVEKLKNAYQDLTPGSAIAQQTRSIVAQSEEILNAWVDVATDAVVNYNLQDEQKNNTPGGVRMSSRNTGYDYAKPFSEQVEDYKNGLIPKGDTLIVGETPEVFRGIGMNALPVTINTSHVDYALNGTKDFDHHLGESLLKQLPNALKSPVAIMTSGTKSGSSVVAMLEIRHNGKQVVVPVSVDGFGRQNGIRIDSNAITSMYGKDYSISRVLRNAIEQETKGQFRLFYLDEKKATALLQGAKVLMPKMPATRNGGYVHSLTDAASPVKLKFGNVTESQQFKRWFGDWQNDPANASKVVNGDGTPKVVYHQTGGLFNVFDTRREGAGSRDEGTPFGIFLKGSDRDIGLSGKFQMGLYADIKNPLRANNRDDLRYKIMQISDEYATLIAEHNRIDSEYKTKVDNAIKELREFMLEWRKENPNASRTALYDVPRFNELFEAEDTITDEWTAKIAEVSSKAKEAMTEALEKNGYDGVFLAEDAGSFGRSTDAFIALRPEQVKSATNNLGTFDASNPDIRFSQRSAAQLERENEKLRRDKEYLKELVRIQRQGNKDVVPTRASVIKQAEELKKAAGARGNTNELAAVLDKLYRHIGKGTDMSQAILDQLAGDAADWLMEHQPVQRDSYSQDVLDWMKKRHVSLSQTQVDEIKYQYGSLREFQSAIKGSIIIDQKANTSLNQLWQEGASQFADQFDADMNEGDMPGAFADLVERLRNSESAETAEARYYREEIRRDLVGKVYDTYFNVKPIDSVSDAMQEKIDALKEKREAERKKYKEKIEGLKTEKKSQKKVNAATLRAMQDIRREALNGYRKQQTISDRRLRWLYEKQYRLIMEDYQKQLDKAEGGKTSERVEGWRKTEERGSLQRTLGTLNKMMLHPTKSAFVPDHLQPAVIKAMEAMNNYRLSEKIDMEKIRSLHRELDKLLLDGARKNEARIRQINRQLDKLQGDYGSVQDCMAELKRGYAELRESNEGKVKQIYDEVVEDLIDNAMEKVGGTSYNDLNVQQLEALNEAYAAILARIRKANKTFAYERQMEISKLAETVGEELKRAPDREKLSGEKAGALEKFGWNNLKPEYAFERLGSATMTTLYHNLRKGEDTFYQDVVDARGFALGAMTRHGYQNWKDQTIEYESVDEKKFSLNLEERMSLYAYSRRRQAIEHLMMGGIVLNENTKRVVKNKLGIQTEKVFHDYNNYRLSLETIQAIGESLTQQQRAFAEEMQGYLSTVCADKNNEISRALYGVSKAKEKYYWPLKSSNLFSERERNQQQNPGNRQKNAGHMKATTPHANNPVEIAGFMETWGNHVNNTAMYHAFALPMEDFLRVYNFNNTSGAAEESIVQLITKKHGKGATDYIDQFLKDLNQGVRADPRETIASSLTSKFKKGAVSASLSVAIQQPSAVGRAFAVIDPKYFSLADLRYYATSTVKQETAEKQWEKVKEYAPVAGIKEMGRFDVNMGMSTVDFITGAGETGFLAKLDEISGYLPERMDQATWLMIWNAAERQCKAQGYKGEALNVAAGKLFTECITKTQVYDSVFSRSGNMRSKSLYMNMATSFMAEPTTTANMVQSALADLKNKNYKAAGRKMASVATATVLNAILASLVYAARDDDEDKPYKEKYLKSLTSELVDGINPLGYVPIAKDIWSLLQGYDVERSDMALWSTAIDIFNRLKDAHEAMASLSEDDADYEEKLAAAQKKVRDGWQDAAGAICNLLGIPAKNALREIRALVNTWETVGEGRKMDGETAQYAMWEAVQEYAPKIVRDTDNRNEELFKAMESDSEVWINRMKAHYDNDEKAFESAVRSALRQEEPRIRMGAKMLSENPNSSEYKRLVQDMVKEGHFTKEQVEGAIQAEATSIKGEFADYSAKTVAKFVDLYEDNLLTAEQFTDFWEYQGEKDENDKQKHSQEEIVVYIARMKVNAKAKDTLFLKVMGYTEKKLDSTPWHSSGYTAWEAKAEHPVLAEAGDTAAQKYVEIQNKEISADLFAKAWMFKYEKGEDDKRLYDWKDVRDYIDALPISDYSKDELFLALGYNEKTLKKIRWS